ncbi:MAG: thioredoxin-disulfide reductase [Planctomycetota bacterium]|jgi:thioredoxin reductase (NADPH)
MSDVVILGSGPAGCTAAIYLGRAGFTTRVLEGMQAGGQLTITTEVDNFPGFPEGIQGPDLMQGMRKQAERFGAEFETREVEEVDFTAETLRLKTGDDWIEGKAVIVATGASARWLGVEGEQALRGRGVSACATCDGAFFNGREIAIVGGGDSAVTEAMFLTRFASKVTLIHRRQGFRAAKINIDHANENPKIEFLLDSVIEEVVGKERVQGAKVKDLKTGEVTELPLEGVFVAIGHDPNTAFLRGKIDLDDEGYVILRDGTRTSADGVFAAGDVVDKVYKQAITAAGMGCQAALDAEKYLAERGV